MAFIFKAPHCKYFIAGFTDAKGKRRNRSTRLTDRKKAQKQADDWEAAWRGKLSAKQFERVLLEGIENISGETKLARSFEAYMAEWFAAKKVEIAESTVHRLKPVLDRFAKHLGAKAQRPLREISQSDIASFRNQETERVSASSANLELKFLKMLFRAAKADGFIDENPAENVKTISRKGDKHGRRPFTLDELRSILSVADPEWKSMVLCSIYLGGQRLGDVAALTQANFDMERREARLQTLKTKRQLILPIVGPMMRHLETLKISDDRFEPLHPRAFKILQEQGRTAALSNAFSDLLAEAGLKPAIAHRKNGDGRNVRRSASSLGFHCLRSTAVSFLHDAGIPAAVVQDLVGHNSAEIHRRYIKLGRESYERALTALPDLG